MPEVLVVKHWDEEELKELGWEGLADFAKDLGYPEAELAACLFVDPYEGEQYPETIDLEDLPVGENFECTVSQVAHSRLFDDRVTFRVLEWLKEGEEFIGVPIDGFKWG